MSGFPSQEVFTFGDVTLSSNFDNGNLRKVEEGSKPFEYRIWTSPDNYGTPHESGHNSWFYFYITGVIPQGSLLRFYIMNANKHASLYRQDMRPVFRSDATGSKWHRIRSAVKFQHDSPLVFEHTTDTANDKIYFAFTYPYTYSMVQEDLAALDAHVNNLSVPTSIYYVRELLTETPDRNRVDLLTITSAAGASNDQESELPHLFPSCPGRPLMFPSKDIIFISARVHPGEVPAQHVFKGILQFLMDENDLRAKELRKRYVFKLIPMLNPDGVCRGHFRMDQFGNNLNRHYLNPDHYTHASIFAVKSLLEYYNSTSNIAMYLDLHAHASKRGCFIYGNVMDSMEDQVQNQLYCRLIALNTPHFDYDGCLFSREHMTRIDPGDQRSGLTAEGSGRVSTYTQHRVIHSYTLECNYNTSKTANEIPPMDTDPGGKYVLSASHFTSSPEKYTPHTYAGVGIACVVAMLDIRGHNPCSRIPNSKNKTLDRIRGLVLAEVRSRPEYKGQVLAGRHRSSSARVTPGDTEEIVWRCRVGDPATVSVPTVTEHKVKRQQSSGKSSSRVMRTNSEGVVLPVVVDKPTASKMSKAKPPASKKPPVKRSEQSVKGMSIEFGAVKSSSSSGCRAVPPEAVGPRVPLMVKKHRMKTLMRKYPNGSAGDDGADIVPIVSSLKAHDRNDECDTEESICRRDDSIYAVSKELSFASVSPRAQEPVPRVQRDVKLCLIGESPRGQRRKDGQCGSESIASASIGNTPRDPSPRASTSFATCKAETTLLRIDAKPAFSQSPPLGSTSPSFCINEVNDTMVPQATNGQQEVDITVPDGDIPLNYSDDYFREGDTGPDCEITVIPPPLAERECDTLEYIPPSIQNRMMLRSSQGSRSPRPTAIAQ